MKRAAGLVALLTIAVAGCLFSPDPKTHENPLPPKPPLPDTQDKLMANFRAAYTGSDIETYSQALHPGYVFLLRPEAVLPGEGDRFTCAKELAAAENMFSGLPIERPGHVFVPAISAISIATLDRQGAWIAIGPSDPDFPNTWRGVYTIQISFSRADASTIIVTGAQEFYVSARDSLVDGVPKPFYQLRGQRDLSGESKGVEGDSWGAVKCLYSN